MHEELGYLSATELTARYRARDLSPVEVAEAVLARVDRLNPKINAFCFVDADGALAGARDSEQRWAKGAPLGPLDGVPVSVKDLLLTRGWPTLRGSRTIDPAGPWTDDAPAVARLRESGAVILGKTTTPEYGWKGVTDSPLTGVTRNPWNLARTPGGSSGGAAAQLAAGLGPLAIGTDGGGSIRIPSAFTGVTGIKPSFGRVPAWPLSPFGTVAHVGPIARTTADCALMLNVLARPDARDWYALPYAGTDWTAGIDGGVRNLRIAYSPRLGYVREVDAEIEMRVAEAARTLETLGARVEQADPGFADCGELFWRIWTIGAYNGLRHLAPAKLAMLEPALQEAYRAGERALLTSYLDASAARAELGTRMRLFHERYDLLVTPALAVPAFDVGLLAPPRPGSLARWTDWTPFSFPFNLSQQPAMSLPCGFTHDGLPVGLQIVGPMHREDLVLRAGNAFELATGFARRRPPLDAQVRESP
jgi:aspartyl-tRNA(Asn)/glutamyl-tRNA(Gln) amidotransferase subunit A